jgi:hypothetical protein
VRRRFAGADVMTGQRRDDEHVAAGGTDCGRFIFSIDQHFRGRLGFWDGDFISRFDLDVTKD